MEESVLASDVLSYREFSHLKLHHGTRDNRTAQLTVLYDK